MRGLEGRLMRPRGAFVDTGLWRCRIKHGSFTLGQFVGT